MRLPTLDDRAVRDETRKRLSRFSPELPRQWGTLTPGEVVCHLAICYRMASGQLDPALPLWSERSGPLHRTLLKYGGLYMPLRWPHGAPTLPEVKAGAPGVVPGDFGEDRDRLLASYDEFLTSTALGTVRHPIFGPLTRWEWMRWGYLHADHHLRQFVL